MRGTFYQQIKMRGYATKAQVVACLNDVLFQLEPVEGMYPSIYAWRLEKLQLALENGGSVWLLEADVMGLFSRCVSLIERAWDAGRIYGVIQ